MLFFRSEERVRAWCAAHGYPMRPLVTMDQLTGFDAQVLICYSRAASSSSRFAGHQAQLECN